MDVSDIADPRTFPDLGHAAAADVTLYDVAARSLVAGTARESDALLAQLRDALGARLHRDRAALAPLFADAPSIDVARALWRALDAAWNAAVRGEEGIAVTIFAMPIVVVAAGVGASAGVVRGALSDTAPLDALLRQHRALRGNDTLALAKPLVSPDALDVSRLPDVLSWHRIDPRGVPMCALTEAPIPYAAGREESVHARLLVGSAVAAQRVDLLERAPIQGWAIPFTRELARQLAVPDAVVLALPAAPARPLHAVRLARASQREVAAQLFASNAVRRIRSRSGEPVAVVSAHRADDAPGGGELRVSLSSPFDARDAEGFRCPLYPIDRAADVARMLVSLLRECRVADVRVLAGVHADRIEGTSQPLLFKPDSLPRTPAMH